ncbi:site-specific DNA recombinase [Vibrio crassostreae]|nr:site-specific DNA recombinase [Vibrio crassostreae]
MKPLAYSYLRFSTQRQAKGDSMRRQLESARMYAKENDLELQEKTFNDFGVSAFTGKNARSGELGYFQQLVEQGEIPQGSYLLVENHDRLSRMTPEKALPRFQDLVEAGIIIVTLHDREVYRRGEMDVLRLMKSIIYMERAHNESMVKSKRGQSIWEKRREDSVASGKITKASKLPVWLEWNGEEISVVEDKAKTVRTMFVWYNSGVGYQTIARRLNDLGTPTFGRGVEWRAAAISKILKNRAVIGEFQFHQKNNDGIRIPIGDVIRNAYPSIVSHKVYQVAQSLMRERDNHSGQYSRNKVHNLFTSLVTCGNCGSPMTVATKCKATDKHPARTHFVCTRASSGGGECLNLNWDSKVIEEHFRQAFTEFIDLYTQGDTDEKAQVELDEKIAILNREIESKKAALDNMVKAIELGGELSVLVQKVASLQNDIVQIGQDIEDLQAEAQPLVQSAEMKSQRAEQMKRSLSELEYGDPKALAIKRQQFNADLRSIFKSISLHWCYYTNRGAMNFIDHYEQDALELQFELGLEVGEALILVEKVYDTPELMGDVYGDNAESSQRDFEYEPRYKVVPTYVERSKQAKGAAERRIKDKMTKADLLISEGLLEGVIAGFRNSRVSGDAATHH